MTSWKIGYMQDISVWNLPVGRPDEQIVVLEAAKNGP